MKSWWLPLVALTGKFTERLIITPNQINQLRSKVNELGMTSEERQTIRRAGRKRALEAQQDFIFKLVSPDSAQTPGSVWFWFNHVNVFWQKGEVGLHLRDYLNGAIRPHLGGSYKQLLQATLKHPAMLVYLDNARNQLGRINENYARELLELHTLGVSAGYTQQDIKQVASLLTGFRVTRSTITPEGSGTFVQPGRAIYEPNRQEPGPWVVMGQTISSSGLESIDELVSLLAIHPSTARNIAQKLSVYILGDEPPKGVVSAAAEVFRASNGNIGKTADVLLKASATVSTSDCPPSFTTPMVYVVRVVRWLSAGAELQDAKPVLRWLTALGQPLFGSRTPNGYSLYGRDWLSSGQLTQRFDLAQEMVAALPRLFQNPPSVQAIWQQPATERWLSRLSPEQRRMVMGAYTGAERLALLLASPVVMYRHAGDFYAQA